MIQKNIKRALVLLGHGARSPEWAAPFLHVQKIVQSSQPEVSIELAFLEFMQPDLPASVRHLAQQGHAEITVVPLFLGQSGHVLRDLPPMMAELQQEYPAITFRLTRAAGEDAGVLESMAAYCLTALTDD